MPSEKYHWRSKDLIAGKRECPPKLMRRNPSDRRQPVRRLVYPDAEGIPASPLADMPDLFGVAVYEACF